MASERRDTQRDSREMIKQMAAHEFAEHRIEQKDPNRWRCSKPGTGIYSFNVLIVPGLVIVYGDVGDAMLRCSYGDQTQIIEWLRGSCRDWDYLCGKLLFKKAFEHFYADDAVDYVSERLKEAEERGDEIDVKRYQDLKTDVDEYRRNGDLHEHEWGEIVMEQVGDCDMAGVGMGLDPHAFWTVECLACFVRLYDQGSGVASCDHKFVDSKNCLKCGWEP